MYLHPIVIHFPIALLTLYAVLELVRYKRIVDQPYWSYVKAVLVIFGTLGALVALITGDMASEGISGETRILELHEFFAFTTFFLALVSAKAYALKWFVWPENRFSNFVLKPKVIIIIASLILVSITITGGLGAGMVRGTEFDPLMKPIFKLLGVY